ncbi:MAG: RNB domain-containing ribonuclease [Acidimicrobiales bacterium]
MVRSTGRRGRTQTYYAPDRRVPMHPPVLGEGAASLLPDGPRPAVLWTIDVAGDGTTQAVDVRRATVRSRAQLTYADVQADLDAGRAPARWPPCRRWARRCSPTPDGAARSTSASPSRW